MVSFLFNPICAWLGVDLITLILIIILLIIIFKD